MKLSRRGSYRDHGVTVLFDTKRQLLGGLWSIRWDDEVRAIVVVIGGVRDGGSTHQYRLQLSSAEVLRLVAAGMRKKKPRKRVY